MITTAKRRLFISFLSISLVVPMFMGLTGQKVDAANTTIKLDPNHLQQSWEGWGTSLAWFGNITGGWNDKVKEAMADALYSPDGLNFNIARYNIGGGENPAYNSMRQGGDVPGFSPSPGVFDWAQDANQRWWLQAVKERGANILEAFSNSAPYYMTVSGSTTGHWESSKDNLKPDEYENFANYLTEVVKHFKEEWNIDFNYLSPVNEPSTNYWGFGGGQEGSHWDVASQIKIINATRAKLDAANLQSVQIAAMDESILDTFVSNWNSYDETTKSNIGKMNTHSYGGSKRAEIRDAAKEAGKTLWMSEVDLGPSGIAHDHDDFEPALALAERIMTDITWLEPKAWITWQAFESEKNMQKDKENMNWGLLHADFDTQEWWYTKKYYAMQQFSKFIPQGSNFIGDNDDNTLAAYDPSTNKVHIVYRNPNVTSQNISLDLSQFDTVTGDATPYVSSATENVVQKGKIPVLDKMLQATVSAKSITTFVIDGASFTSNLLIPQNDMTVTASSAQSGEEAERTLDGNNWTIWHTSWEPYNAGPHSITYDLGAQYDDVYKLSYLPRQDKDENGIVTKFTIEVSLDGDNFTPVAIGTWKNDKSEKTATFSSRKAKFVRLKVDESNGSGAKYASAAEINIMRKSNFTVDTTLLANAISRAEDYISANNVNVNVSHLQDLVDEAKVVQKNTLATQEEIIQIVYKLNVEYSVLGQGLIPQSQMKATSDNSASEDGPEKTIDGDILTKWHTAYNNEYSTLPHSITYNLGKAYNSIYKLQYLPRQDADWNGVITKFEVSVSDDGDKFTKVVAKGTWNADKTEKTATFNAQGAKYVRFTALESRSDAGKQYASAAEINIFNKQGYKVDFSSLDSAIQAAEKFKSNSEKDESYFKNLDAILIQADTLLKSASATQEEIVKFASLIFTEISNIQNSNQNIKGMSLFYTPEAYHANPASLMVDNDISTFYESNWDKNGRKYKSGDYIVIDLGESVPDVGKVLVTPRLDKANGRIKQFKIYYSNANLKNLPADAVGTQAYLDDNFKFAANGSFDDYSSSVQSATIKSVEARYIAIQAITTGGDGNTLSTAEIAVSQKQTATFDTSKLQAAIDHLLTLSSISPKVEAAIEKQITTMGDLSDLTEESISHYTKQINDLYNVYLTVNNRSSIKSGEVWLDTEGVPIQAHGGGILYNEKNKTYYWYGEDKTEGYLPTGVHAYSSKDLYKWQNEGIVLPVFNNPQLGEDVVTAGNDLPLYLDENSETYKNSGVPYDPDRKVEIKNKDEDYTGNMKAPNNTLSKHNSPARIAELNALYVNYSNEEKQKMYKDFNWDKVVERPKVVYNKKNNTYVMWWHQDGPIAGEYWTAEGGVAVSDSPTGPFKYLGTSRLPNVGDKDGNEGMLRDMTLYVDEDGNEATHDKAYLVYSSEENVTTVIMMLNDDYTGPAQNEKGETLEGTHYVRAFSYKREAPAIFKQDGAYYMISSGLTGWNPNRAEYHVSTQGMFGPWEYKGDPMVNDYDGTTFRSQSTFVLPYRDGNGALVPNKFIFMADRWYPNNLSDSRYVWLPLELDNENRRVAISWQDEWKVSQLNTGTTINFNSNGGSSISSLYGAEVGTKITAPAEPTREGFKFVNWYKDEALSTVWDFTIDTVPTNDITLYGKWVRVAAPVITNIMPVNVATVTGIPPVLPTVVTAVYSDGTTQDKSVVWGVIDPSQYAEAGSFSVRGVVDGTVIPAVANVIISEDVYRAQLAARIADAQAIHDVALEGMDVSQYPIGSKQKLLDSIMEAQQVLDNDSATQTELEQATLDLNSAHQVFEASKNQHVKVQSISITSASSSIEVTKGTLQLQAEVQPANATNKTVTWAVYEADGKTVADKAIINTNGLLTAAKNGVVKVVATSVDNTTVYGIKEIMISGQNDSPEPTLSPGTNPGNPTTSTSSTPTPSTPPTKEDPHRYVPTGIELQNETAQNGTTSLTINIDKEALAKKLEALNQATGSPNLDIEIPGMISWNAVNLPLDVLYNSMKANKDTIITLRGHLGSYELPLASLNREELEKAAKVTGATLIIRMDQATSQHEQKFEQSKLEQGLKRVSDIIAYKVILKSNDKEEELQRFGNPFMTHVINMDGVTQDPATATAVIFDPITGQMRFVPSVFTVKNGKTEVSIFSQANGVYAIVQNKKTFDDMMGHWALKDVETLASKLIINGMSDRTFAPAGKVTRAQFAALLVRGLGLSTESLSNVFADVNTTAWYAQDVNTAAKLGLVQGVGEAKFSPDSRITREQMVVMIMNAVQLVQGEHRAEAQLRTPFTDQASISGYATQAVTEAAAKGIIKGKTETTFAPQDAATRAEAAVMIKQILQYLKFMN
ncbi:discoidin domain-containing protein [Paenibacillus sp. FSL K6-2859]|uniref:discoidin domain-containing protein n=1 Tax=Paenibacillus sp. FSL K6-2859 TaxID=2921482 RepID=UPI0030FBBFE1